VKTRKGSFEEFQAAKDKAKKDGEEEEDEEEGE